MKLLPPVIPDFLCLLTAAAGLISFSPAQFFGVLAALPLLIAALIRPECMGGGDIKLTAAAGFVLGFWRGIWGMALGLLLAVLYFCTATALTVEQGVRFLESHILPHQNRSILKNRADEIAMQFQSVLAKNNRQGIRTQAEKKEVASAWLELAISCAKVPVKYEADEIKRRQKEEKTQRETEPVMA